MIVRVLSVLVLSVFLTVLPQGVEAEKALDRPDRLDPKAVPVSLLFAYHHFYGDHWDQDRDAAWMDLKSYHVINPDPKIRSEHEAYLRGAGVKSDFLTKFREAREWVDGLQARSSADLFGLYQQYEQGPAASGATVIARHIFGFLNERRYWPMLHVEAGRRFARGDAFGGNLYLALHFRHGVWKAGLEIARRFEVGDGLLPSPVLAFYWTALAAGKSDDESILPLLERRESVLTPVQEQNVRELMSWPVVYDGVEEPDYDFACSGDGCLP